ncbi:MAG: acyltransferase [Pseudomonadota bacterium]
MQNQIQSLTGLRGLAALIVFVSHGANQGVLPRVFGNGFGQIGVMLFFVLSGFLMAHLYLYQEASRKTLSSFVLARVGRVFPLYLALILTSYLIIASGLKPDFHYRVDSVLTLSESLLFLRAPNEFWTIPVEVQFYALFLILWITFARKPTGSVVPIVSLWVASAIPSAAYWLYNGGVLPLVTTYATPFMLGLLLAGLFRTAQESEPQLRWSNRLGLLFLLAVLLNLPSLRLDYGLTLGEGFYLRTWLDPLNWALVLGLFYCAMLSARSLNFLSGALMAYFGGISYALYLFHYPVLIAVSETALPTVLKFPIAFLIVVGLAHLSGRYLEVPAAKFVRRFGKR